MALVWKRHGDNWQGFDTGRFLIASVVRYDAPVPHWSGLPIWGVDAEAFLPVVGDVVQALFEVLAAILHEQRHHAFLVHRPRPHAQLTGAGGGEEHHEHVLGALVDSRLQGRVGHHGAVPE